MDGQLTQERRRSTARVTDVARLSMIFGQIERAIGVGIGILLCLAATLAQQILSWRLTSSAPRYRAVRRVSGKASGDNAVSPSASN